MYSSIVIECILCHKKSKMEYTQLKGFKLPNNWLVRSRDWGDNKPEEFQIVCSNECAKKL